jgi:hypothetical protein
MTGRLYLHIGPPKTATTAFQYALQDGIPGLLVYGGVRQPRSSEKSELSYRLHRLCARFRGNVSAEIKDVRETIAATLAKGTSLLISEELFLVDGRSASFQKKIVRLGQVVGPLRPTIIVCARDPRDGLPSLYQELYRNLPIGQKLSFKRFVRSNQAEIFDYLGLIRLLTQADFQNIRVIAFERLVAGALTFSDMFDSRLGSKEKLVVPRTNVGSYDRAKNLRVLKPLELRDVFVFRRFLSKIVPKRLRQNSIIEKFGEILGGVPLTRSRAKCLVLPDAMANRFREGYLAVVSGKSDLNRE